jgi:ribose/xylose/arabinose/galactoside ABC-type transport system permease subunit/ABC-type multidrug transport system ATPase subunit
MAIRAIATLRSQAAAAVRSQAAAAPGPNTNRIGLAAVAGLLVLFFSLRHDTFLTTGNAIAIGLNMSSIAIAGMGTAVLLITGNVDLSIGSMYGLLGMIVAEVAAHVSNPVVPVAAGLLCGLALGTVNGTLVRLLKISPLIVTIGLLTVYAGLGYVVNPNFISGFQTSFINIGRGQLGSIPYPVIFAAVVMLIVGVVLTRTVLGLRLYATGGDARAAERAGVRVHRLVLGAYAFNGMLIGLIAVLTTAQLGSGSPTLGANFEFDVLTAVILGGVAFTGGAGRPLGVLIGVLTIGILNAGLIFEGLQNWWQQIAKGMILLFALGTDQVLAARRNRKASRAEERPADSAGAAGAAGVRDGEPALQDDEGPPVLPVPSGPAGGSVDQQARAPGQPVLEVPVLEVKEVSKRFGAVRALEPTSLTLHAGEVVALLGDNGAGKSTLVKIISGALTPDEGELRICGERAAFKDPAGARAAGVETVYQDLALCQNLSVIHNLVLGSEPVRRYGPVRLRDDRTAAAATRGRLAALGIRLPDPSLLVESLSGGQRQAIAVARTLADHVRLVCLDEPTAALGVTQTAQVLKLVRSVADQGTSVLMITHDVASVLRVCDRVVVLRRGRLVYHGLTSELNELELLQLMAGIERTRQPAGARTARTL